MTQGPSTRERGLAAEARAAEYLRRQGLKVVAQNVRCRVGELDLVCRDGDVLVIVEVRQRTAHDYGGALASVTRRKQCRVRRAAAYCWQRDHSWQRHALRFDVVALQTQNGEEVIDWVKDAFR